MVEVKKQQLEMLLYNLPSVVDGWMAFGRPVLKSLQILVNILNYSEFSKKTIKSFHY